jgi:hypothetical protein
MSRSRRLIATLLAVFASAFPCISVYGASPSANPEGAPHILIAIFATSGPAEGDPKWTSGMTLAATAVKSTRNVATSEKDVDFDEQPVGRPFSIEFRVITGWFTCFHVN